VESVFPVVFVKPAPSGQLVPDARLFIEGHAGICSGRGAENCAETAVKPGKILLGGLVDSLSELEAHLHQRDQTWHEDASVHRDLISQPIGAVRMQHTIHATLIMPKHINKLSISLDNNNRTLNGDPQTRTRSVQILPQIRSEFPAILCCEVHGLPDSLQLSEESAHAEEVLAALG
jgi:hypothetical protein